MKDVDKAQNFLKNEEATIVNEKKKLNRIKQVKDTLKSKIVTIFNDIGKLVNEEVHEIRPDKIKNKSKIKQTLTKIMKESRNLIGDANINHNTSLLDDVENIDNAEKSISKL